MSVPDLPEDMTQWPRDPYDILGVERTCSEDELRKAYGKRIRRFKPEHHPAQFQRIREAYDQAKMYLAWAGAPTPQSLPGSEPSDSPGQVVPKNELEEIDDLIRAGNAEPALETLRRLADRQGVYPALAARFFWLTTIWPQLDPDHAGCHWLVRGLRQSPQDFRLWNLLRCTLDEKPQEALTSHYVELAQSLPAGPILFEALALRWRASALLQRWGVIAQDVDQFASQAQTDPLCWARLRFLALDYLIWQGDDHLHNRCQEWIDSLQGESHLHNEMQNELHRLDILLDLYDNVLRLESTPGMEVIVQVATRSWYQRILEYRPHLFAVMEDLLTDVAAGLEKLDRVQRSAPVLIGQLLRATEGLRYLSRTATDPEIRERPLVEATLDYLRSLASFDYSQFRVAFLYFCLKEYVEIPLLVSLLARHDFGQEVTYCLARAFEDAPLVCLVQMHCLFWR